MARLEGEVHLHDYVDTMYLVGFLGTIAVGPVHAPFINKAPLSKGIHGRRHNTSTSNPAPTTAVQMDRLEGEVHLHAQVKTIKLVESLGVVTVGPAHASFIGKAPPNQCTRGRGCNTSTSNPAPTTAVQVDRLEGEVHLHDWVSTTPPVVPLGGVAVGPVHAAYLVTVIMLP